jgi:predicted SAM-dependent methyltransferase
MQIFKPAEVWLRKVRNRIARVSHRGTAVTCPVCSESFKGYLPAGRGDKIRPNAICPGCRSRERDRLVMLFIRKFPEPLIQRQMTLLHIAPEPCLQTHFRSDIGAGYRSADLIRRDVDMQMDVQNLQLEDGSVDAVFCSHVLQDVPDDVKALKEIARILRPEGWAILNIPMLVERTHEHHTPKNERSGWDKRPPEHLRSYGPDYVDRLRGAGFIVTVSAADDLTDTAEERLRFGIDGDGTGVVHFVQKPPA